MTAGRRCQCGRLAQWASDPSTPFRYHPETDSYSLELSAAVLVADVTCVCCGGYPSHPPPAEAPRCRCRFIEQCERDGCLPIELSEVGTLRMLHCGEDDTERHIALWFCPACGGIVFP